MLRNHGLWFWGLRFLVCHGPVVGTFSETITTIISHISLVHRILGKCTVNPSLTEPTGCLCSSDNYIAVNLSIYLYDFSISRALCSVLCHIWRWSKWRRGGGAPLTLEKRRESRLLFFPHISEEKPGRAHSVTVCTKLVRVICTRFVFKRLLNKSKLGRKKPLRQNSQGTGTYVLG